MSIQVAEGVLGATLVVPPAVLAHRLRAATEWA